MKKLLILLGMICLLSSCSLGEEVKVNKISETSQPVVKQPENKNSKYTICIDPGHQDKPMLDKEPIYPGAKEFKYKVAAGTSGVVTGKKEYELALEVSLKLQDKLEKNGFNVVMTRDRNDVSLSNIDRAHIGNDANADLVVRVHADSNASSKTEGSTILYPVGKHTEPINNASLKAATIMEQEYRLATGAKSRGLMPRSDMTGFNHSTVTSIIVEMGFMSNPNEDMLMETNEYQDKIIKGIYNGIVEYCETINK